MHLELYNADFLNFVEFNITGDNDEYKRCDVESKYIDSSVFDLVQPSFENANPTFDYFSGTKYNARKIFVLRNDLLANKKLFEEINDLKSFTDLISSRFMGAEFLAGLDESDSGWQGDWQNYNKKIIGLHKDLIELIEKCADQERILWVIGY
jgi:hypothetical protein